MIKKVKLLERMEKLLSIQPFLTI